MAKSTCGREAGKQPGVIDAWLGSRSHVAMCAESVCHLRKEEEQGKDAHDVDVDAVDLDDPEACGVGVLNASGLVVLSSRQGQVSGWYPLLKDGFCCTNAHMPIPAGCSGTRDPTRWI